MNETPVISNVEIYNQAIDMAADVLDAGGDFKQALYTGLNIIIDKGDQEIFCQALNNARPKGLKKNPGKYYKINNIMGIVLKSVVTICIIVLTVIYWQQRYTGKYQNIAYQDGNYVVFDTQTGVYTFVVKTRDQHLRTKMNPFASDSKNIFGQPEYFIPNSLTH